MKIFIVKFLSGLCFAGSLISAFLSFPFYDSGGEGIFGGYKGHDFFMGFMFIIIALVLLATGVYLLKLGFFVIPCGFSYFPILVKALPLGVASGQP
jgi:uncharacterized membrane protein